MFRRLHGAAWCCAALLVLSVSLDGCTSGGRGTAVPTATVALATPSTAPAPSATPAPANTEQPTATPAPSATLPPAITVAPTLAASPRPPSTAAGRVSVDQGGVRFAYDPSLAVSVTFGIEPAGETMGGVYPAYRSYRLEGYPLTSRYGLPAEVKVFSVAEYQKVEPDIAKDTTRLAALATGKAVLTTTVQMPLPPLTGAARVGVTRMSQLGFAQGSGIRYLATYVQAAWVYSNPLRYHFVGLTSDEQYYVEITFLVNASIVRDQPNLVEEEKVREFNRKIGVQLGDLAASEFEPNLDRLDDLVRSIVVSAPTGAAQAPTMTPAPTKAPATPSSAGAPCIASFSLSSTEARPGDKVTLTWQATGDKAFVTHDCRSCETPAELVEVPLAGTYTFTIDPALRWPTFTYWLYVRVGEVQASSYALVYITCPDNWFFAPNSVGCPLPAVRTTIVAQRFERGMMLWSSANKRIYVLPGPEPYQSYHIREDNWKEGMPDSDPSIVAPPGLYQPVRGFGLVWRTTKLSQSPDVLVRDHLGWATGPEFTVGEGFVQEWPQPRLQTVVFITGPDKDVYALWGMSGWSVYTTPTPGPTPTNRPAPASSPTCPTAMGLAGSGG